MVPGAGLEPGFRCLERNHEQVLAVVPVLDPAAPDLARSPAALVAHHDEHRQRMARCRLDRLDFVLVLRPLPVGDRVVIEKKLIGRRRRSCRYGAALWRARLHRWPAFAQSLRKHRSDHEQCDVH